MEEKRYFLNSKNDRSKMSNLVHNMSMDIDLRSLDIEGKEDIFLKHKILPTVVAVIINNHIASGIDICSLSGR